MPFHIGSPRGVYGTPIASFYGILRGSRADPVWSVADRCLLACPPCCTGRCMRCCTVATTCEQQAPATAAPNGRSSLPPSCDTTSPESLPRCARQDRCPLEASFSALSLLGTVPIVTVSAVTLDPGECGNRIRNPDLVGPRARGPQSSSEEPGTVPGAVTSPASRCTNPALASRAGLGADDDRRCVRSTCVARAAVRSVARTCPSPRLPCCTGCCTGCCGDAPGQPQQRPARPAKNDRKSAARLCD